MKFAVVFAFNVRMSEKSKVQSANTRLFFLYPGSGSVLESLQASRPLIVVVNELLMGNHQIELASQLANDGYLYYATCR